MNSVLSCRETPDMFARRSWTRHDGGDVSLRAADLNSTEQIWQERALCRGPESSLFFPPTTSERKEDREWREAKAKEICATCPVCSECLDYALSIREPHGIWGGLTEIERRGLLAQQVG